MNYIAILTAALGAAMSQSVSFRLGNVIVSASNNGKPIHFTFGQALTAAEEVLLRGATSGSFQVGSTLVTVTEMPKA